MKNITLSFFLISCSNAKNFGEDGLTVGEEPMVIPEGTGEASSDPFFDESGLNNVLEEMDPTACDALSADYPGLAGATSYFAGSYLSFHQHSKVIMINKYQNKQYM